MGNLDKVGDVDKVDEVNDVDEVGELDNVEAEGEVGDVGEVDGVDEHVYLKGANLACKVGGVITYNNYILYIYYFIMLG